MLCPHGQEGLSQCEHSADKCVCVCREGEGSIFCDFVRTSLWTVPNGTFIQRYSIFKHCLVYCRPFDF